MRARAHVSCVRARACACVRVFVRALRMVYTDKILHYTNTVIITYLVLWGEREREGEGGEEEEEEITFHRDVNSDRSREFGEL